MKKFFICAVAALLFSGVVWADNPVSAGSKGRREFNDGWKFKTMVAGYFVFGEVITILGYIGCILIIGGLVFSDKFKWDYSKRKNQE